MLEKIFFSVVVIKILTISVSCSTTGKCLEENECLCKISEYSEINISPLFDGSTTKFLTASANIGGNTYITYFFAGCKDAEIDAKNFYPSITNITVGSLVKYNVTWNVATSKSEVSFGLLGKSSQIKFEPPPSSENHYQLVYKTKNTTDSLPTVVLVCDDLKGSNLGISNAETDSLVLFSPTACPITLHHGLSTGSVLVIMFFIGLGIYFIGGSLLLYFVRGARGLEIFPNIDFWRELPGLVKDGIVFIFSGCKPTVVSTAESYDRI